MAGSNGLSRAPCSAYTGLMNDVTCRSYVPGDLSACLAIFDSNVPTFFAPGEREEFRAFLDDVDAGDRPYLVLTRAGMVIACGGLMVEANARRAGLAWGMVDRAWHGQGLGTCLTRARLELARAIPDLAELTLATSQHTRRFYAGFGFIAAKVIPDGFGAGLDRWDMTLRLG